LRRIARSLHGSAGVFAPESAGERRLAFAVSFGAASAADHVKFNAHREAFCRVRAMRRRISTFSRTEDLRRIAVSIIV
jgi:hypothetical protein